MVCEGCDQEIALGALTCPNCGRRTAWGREVRLEPYLRWGFAVVGVAVLAVLGYLLKTHAVVAPHI